MKRGSTLLVILASILILCLLGLAGFVTILNRSMPSSKASPAVSLSGETERDEPVYTAKPDGTVVSETNIYDENAQEPAHSYIFVGDSRTVGMHNALFKDGGEDGCSFIAKSGEGYYWFYHDGIVELENALAADPCATVIFNLGVNDLREADRYISLYQELFSTYHDPSFYILSVNPVNDEKCSGASNEEIEAFNEKMEEAFPDQFLDCYAYLEDHGFETADGLHYSNDTYRDIHHFVVMSLAQEDSE